MTRSNMSAFETFLPIGFASSLTSEIAGKGLFADHMLTGLHAGNSHIGVQGRRGAKVDHVDVQVVEQVAPITACMRNAKLAGEVDDLIAARAATATTSTSTP